MITLSGLLSVIKSEKIIKVNYYGQNISMLVQGFDNITDCYVTYKYIKTTD